MSDKPRMSLLCLLFHWVQRQSACSSYVCSVPYWNAREVGLRASGRSLYLGYNDVGVTTLPCVVFCQTKGCFIEPSRIVGRSRVIVLLIGWLFTVATMVKFPGASEGRPNLLLRLPWHHARCRAIECRHTRYPYLVVTNLLDRCLPCIQKCLAFPQVLCPL